MLSGKQWISLKVEPSEKVRIKKAAKELGVQVGELVRRSLRVAIPVLTAMPQPGVNRFEAAEQRK